MRQSITLTTPSVRGSLTKELLRIVHNVSSQKEVVPSTNQLIDFFNPEGRDARNRIWKTIKYLEEKNRIHIEHRGEEQYVYLTAEGRIKLNEDAIWDMVVHNFSNIDCANQRLKEEEHSEMSMTSQLSKA